MKTIRLLAALLFCWPLGTAQAQTVPLQINYQGYFADATGNPLLDGTYVMSFSIFTNANSGDAVWGPQMFDNGGGFGHAPLVQLVGGRCNVVLGYDTNNASIATALNGTNRYLQVSIGSGATTTNIIPRQLMLSAPYALKAASAEQLDGFGWEVFGGTPTSPTNAFISGTRIQSASITVNQIASAAVGNAQLAANAVSGDKIQIPLSIQGNSVAWLVQVTNSGGPAVSGVSTRTHGVFGQGPYAGVYGDSPAGPGVLAIGSPGLRATSSQGSGGVAADFIGNVTVSGAKAFKIDHPLDPANKYLLHSCVESPDMKNIYDGVVTLDSKGEAIVNLPDWFGPLNRDFRYQLTAIGAPAPNLHVAEEVAKSRFKIAGGVKGMKVSWQVTGIRQDAWAKAHRLVVEESKPASERGTYLAPEELNQPAAKGINWKRMNETLPPGRRP